jgi:CBS domain containing-hemolysin-like protein
VKRLFLFFGHVFGLVDKPVLSITRANVEEEAEVLLSGVQDSNGSEVDEVRLFRNALEFSNVLLKDCIVPRTELEAIDVNAGIEALRQLFVESNCSRILVYKENLDNMIGYVHSSDMFDQPEDIQSLLNPLIVVPEFMAANKLLKIFLQRKKSLALVVDEFGGTSGIVTLEDMMEEIFGEIEDEHDEDEYVAKSLNKDEYILSGRLEIEQVNEDFGLSLPVSDDYQTIAGLILAYNEILPQKGEVVELHPNFSFTIIRLVATRIDLVRLKVLDQEG